MGQPKPYTARQERFARQITKRMAQFNVALFRRTKGRFGAKFPGGAPICLLTTTGRKSGQPRTQPLLFTRDGDDVVIVASQGGMSTHPHWFLNLRDNPEVRIQIGTDDRAYVARIATDDEKAALWPKLVDVYKGYDTYQQRTPRNIPVVICSPA